MKKLLGVLFFIITAYAIYFDLTVGTLPSPAPQQVEASSEPQVRQATTTSIPSFTAKVGPGETVISIVEHQLGKSLPVPIDKLIDDFQLLNQGKSPENIQIGSSYLFPDYSN